MDETPHVPPIVLLAGAFTAQQVMSRRKRRRRAEEGEKPRRLSRFLAVTKLLASVGFIGAAVAELAKANTTVSPVSPERSSTLVTSGIFAFTRNPIYLGMAGLLAANALRLRSFAAFLAVPAFMVAIDRWQIPGEEAALAETFGKAWEDYRADVPRWILVDLEIE